MTKQVKPAPKHRAPVERSALVAAPRKALRNTVILSSVAVAVTGATVSTGVLGQGPATSAAGSVDAAAPKVGDATPVSSVQVDDLAERDTSVSRSSRRQALNSVKKASVVQTKVSAMSRTEDMSDEDPRSIGQALLAEFGFSQDQFGCLDSLWTRESNWTWNADNPTSSAYGIPQALPGSKMSSAGADWATNPVTQIRWGLGYIQDRYGSPCGAWAHSESHNWY
ncbi:lytic transglycosylase domain-containing protein [Nocardioides sp. cx-169]|uniref:aggregation-promoting factor C-terminal-like domain-containing protein n=1 Tax=Nocardioides sp. cx-169 TaxID=2899080 RepID=UPI001E482889|nr:lytic transglycosylase domain-containing protein [Nocardioides sp. cx-169]MCD4536421.1 lytic transglycosylase domain-containing protein [Nocardioides sp. cx-169]